MIFALGSAKISNYTVLALPKFKRSEITLNLALRANFVKKDNILSFYQKLVSYVFSIKET